MVQHGLAQLSMARPSPAVCRSMAKPGTAQFGTARHSLACPPTPGGQERAHGEAGGQEVPGDPLCPHPGHACGNGTEGSRQRRPGAGTLPPPPPSGPEQKPHKGTLSAGTRGLCARPSVPPGSTVPGSRGRRRSSDTALSCLTGALFAAAGDKLCPGWAQEPGFGESHAHTRPHAAQKPERPQPLSSRGRFYPVTGRGSKMCCEVSKKKKKAKNPKTSLSLTLRFSPGRSTRCGRGMRCSRGRVWPSPSRRASRKGGYFVCFLFWFW